MTEKRIPTPRDPLTGGAGQAESLNEHGKNAAAASLGRLGGAARALKLSPEKRAEIAKKAADTRWAKDQV